MLQPFNSDICEDICVIRVYKSNQIIIISTFRLNDCKYYVNTNDFL